MAGGKKKSKDVRRKRDRVNTPADKTRDGVAANVAFEARPVAPPPDVALEVADASVARGPLSEIVPVRFEAHVIALVKQRAADDHRSVSSWIRLAVERELRKTP